MNDLTSPDVYNETERTARKQHRCSECRRDRIRKGDRYFSISGLWDGKWERYRICTRCRWAIRRYNAEVHYDDAIGFTQLWESLRERMISRFGYSPVRSRS
jgi:hypothetical protein